MIALVDNDGNSPDEGANGGICLLGALFDGIKFGLKTFTLGLEHFALGLELGTLSFEPLFNEFPPSSGLCFEPRFNGTCSDKFPR